MQQAAQLFEDTLSWLEQNYSRHKFFPERDAVTVDDGTGEVAHGRWSTPALCLL